MPSKGHDFIAQMICLKMKHRGYVIVASDLLDKKLETNKLNIPPTILSHRPDIIGFRERDQSVCIGEAKYFGDINSKRTRQQIKDFTKAVATKSNFKVIFGVPQSEIRTFTKELKNYSSIDKIIILEVPDNLIPK